LCGEDLSLHRTYSKQCKSVDLAQNGVIRGALDGAFTLKDADASSPTLLSDEERESTPSVLSRLKHWIGLDRAIAYTVLARIWSAAAGLVTVLLIARFLTPDEQGYYYTFFSLCALQIVFELGFCFVVLQLAAHECARMTISSDGLVTGDSIAHSRLASVLQQAARWYSVAAALMATTLLPAGLYFFATHQHAGTVVAWRAPWCLLIVVTAITFQMDPLCAFVEGCGFVSQMAKMRICQAIVASLFAWTVMLTGHGLFAPAMLIMGNGVMQAWFLLGHRLRRVLIGLFRHKVAGNSVSWRREIWPFQWRIAITWISSYLIFQIFNPVLFAFEGPVAAGRMGMSLSIATSIGSAGIAWMSTKASPFGAMIARREFAKLDRLFFRTLWQSTSLISAAAAGFFLCLMIGSSVYPRLAARMLPPWTFGLLLLTTIMNHVVSSEALYMRSHKREPLLIQTVVIALVLSISTVTSARFWGTNAVTLGYFIFGGILSIIWGTRTFIAKRREWYASPDVIESAGLGA
jgi:hypothetical protein